MNKTICILLFLITIITPQKAQSQIDEDQLGAWYMYFFKGTINDSPWGFQGDIQYRNWNGIGDLEQLLLRGGVTYTPKQKDILFTFGYGNVQTGAFGDDDATSAESRIYQEALFPTKIGPRFFLTHRFRYEQRWVENQDVRTRYRYNLFINIPITSNEMKLNTFYLALYNELFINGQRSIGNGNTVELFDRNRSYAALGYVISPKLKIQAGYMKQTTDNWSKSQIQVSLHHLL